MTDTTPAATTSPAFTVGPPRMGFHPVVDPAGVTVLSCPTLPLANLAAQALTGGASADDVRAMIEGSLGAPAAVPDPAPAPVVPTNPDGYTDESLAGFVPSDHDAALLAAADTTTARQRVNAQPAVNAAMALDDPTAPIEVDCPALGRSFRFVNPNDVPVFDSMIISQLAAAVDEAPDDDARAAVFVNLAPQFLRAFMLPTDYMAFASASRGRIVGDRYVGGFRGDNGAKVFVEWLAEVVLPRFRRVQPQVNR